MIYSHSNFDIPEDDNESIEDFTKRLDTFNTISEFDAALDEIMRRSDEGSYRLMKMMVQLTGPDGLEDLLLHHDVTPEQIAYFKGPIVVSYPGLLSREMETLCYSSRLELIWHERKSGYVGDEATPAEVMVYLTNAPHLEKPWDDIYAWATDNTVTDEDLEAARQAAGADPSVRGSLNVYENYLISRQLQQTDFSMISEEYRKLAVDIRADAIKGFKERSMRDLTAKTPKKLQFSPEAIKVAPKKLQFSQQPLSLPVKQVEPEVLPTQKLTKLPAPAPRQLSLNPSTPKPLPSSAKLQLPSSQLQLPPGTNDSDG